MSGIFLDVIVPDTIASVRAKLRGFMVGAGLKVTNWRTGDPVQQMFEAEVAAHTVSSQIVAQAIRGNASLDTSTDPGDPDPYDDLNETLEPATGFLSTLGINTYGVTRTGQTFATGSVLFVNAGAVARTLSPNSLVFTWTENSPPSPPPTYQNLADSAVYTEPGGTITVEAGGSLEIPVRCDISGALGSCPSSSLSLTTTLLDCTATNIEPVSGNDRQEAEQYRDMCRIAPSRLSFGGPEDAYKFFATRNLDGTPLVNSLGSAVGITRVWVSKESSTGVTTVYYASASGAPIAEDVTAANANIIAGEFPILGDCITFSGSAATEVAITVSGTAKIKSRAGLDQDEIKAAIVEDLAVAWESFPIGGFDNDGTIGAIYEHDVCSIVKDSYAGLYGVTANLVHDPILTGNVMTLVSAVGDWTITVT
jgi:hypothetical protein